MHRNCIKTCVLSLLLLCTHGHAQNADMLKQKLVNYSSGNLQEKLFVHTDKAFYMTGEIIWFKIYATDAFRNRPLDLSKISYVELISKENKAVLQAKIAMEDAMGNGSFQLPYSINSGSYTLRAYTNWMKNQGAEHFFEKTITIVNALRKPDWQREEPEEKFDVQFFPEGGSLVAGLTSKVAFRIVNAQGKGVAATGAILDNKNDTVAAFSTLRYGMGNFELAVKKGEQYRAVVRTQEGMRLNKSLPPSLPEGIVMRVKEMGDDRIGVQIQSNTGDKSVSLLVHTRQQVSFSATLELTDGSASLELNKKQLGDGISHVTVFRSSGTPVCERLFFKKPASLLLNIKPDAPQYGLRKKVSVDVSALDAKAAPVAANLSMGVYLMDSLQAMDPSDILSYLWLQSELKGNVESPAYYFSSAPGVAEAADNLMLTQGWRRFKWETVLQGSSKEPEFLPELEGHLITGRLVHKRNGMPGVQLPAYLSVPGERSLFAGATSGNDGSLRFNAKNFIGGSEIIVQTYSGSDSLFRIEIANPFFEKFSGQDLPGFILPETQADLLVAHSVQSQVSGTFFPDQQQRFSAPRTMDTLPFYGVPDQRYYLDDYTRFITMEEVMREYIADVRVRKNEDHFSYRIRNTDFNSFFETSPLVLFDGVPVFDVDKVMAFDPLKVKKVDVVARKFYQHNFAHDGVISYSTYQGDLAGFSLDANAIIVDYAGLQLQREFFSPVYETAAQSASRLPDLRNLLFWSPDIRTTGSATKQSFYTSDVPGSYLVIAQGISADGLAGTGVTVILVK